MWLSEIVSLFRNFFISFFYRAVMMFRHQGSDDYGVITAVETELSSESSSSNTSDIHGRFILLERVLQERVEQSARAQGAAPIQETVNADLQDGRFYFLCCMNYYGCLYCHSKNCRRAGRAAHHKCSCQQPITLLNREGNGKIPSHNCEDCGKSFDPQEGRHFCEARVDNLSNTSTTTPTEQKQANTEEEDNEQTKATDLADASFLMKLLRSKLVKTKNEVEVQRIDPSSPLYPVKSFEELPLSEQLRRGVHDMGFNKLPKIQETALPMLLADPPKNMIAQSQSGTGKTEAFVLPMLSKVDATKNVTQVICISPTYERALQTGQVAEKMGKLCPEVKIGYAVRGKRVSKGQKVTDHVIFATPGTLLDWILHRKVLDPKKIKMFVLDDADVMIALQGHQDQSIRIYRTLPKDCQMLLFSATYDDEVMKFAKTVVPDPVIVGLCREEESLDNIKQYYVVCHDKEDKFKALSNIYGAVSIGQGIVFCHTWKSASWLAEKMTENGHSVALLSDKTTVEEWLAVFDRFRDGKEKLLIVAGVSARGIDVEQVTIVVNYDMPVGPSGEPEYKRYLHRISKTGWFGKNSIAVNFIDGQQSTTIIKKIEDYFDKPIVPLRCDDVDQIEKLELGY